MNETDYNITLFEACEILNKSKKTVSRYVRRGRLNPLKVKSQQGTLEYRFTKADLENLRADLARVDTPDRTDKTQETDQTGQTRQDTPPQDKTFLSTKQGQTRQSGQGRQDKTGQDGTGETGHESVIITLLKETTELLKGQLTIKDSQIGTLNDQVHKLIERDRETNILLKGLQDRFMLLEPPKQKAVDVRPAGWAGPKWEVRPQLIVLVIILLLTLGLFLYFNVLPSINY